MILANQGRVIFCVKIEPKYCPQSHVVLMIYVTFILSHQTYLIVYDISRDKKEYFEKAKPVLFLR